MFMRINQPSHPDFIGPRLNKAQRCRLQYQKRCSLKPKRPAPLRPDDPNFIGPPFPMRERMKKYGLKSYYKNKKPKLFSLKPGHPAFIGPRMPRALRRKLNEKRWREENPDRVIQLRKEYEHKNCEVLQAGRKAKNITNKEANRIKRKAYYEKNRVKVAEYGVQYRAKNRAVIKERKRGYARKRVLVDPGYALQRRIRTRIGMAIKNQYTSKAAKTIELIGCSFDDLMAHIEAQWQPGMTWENNTRNGWHIDHIIPCSAFDLTDPDHQKMCFHHTNMRPMWGHENNAKAARLTPEAIALLVTRSETVETDVLPVYIERAG